MVATNKNRQDISLGSSMQDLLVTMAEGNPGAITVLMRLMGTEFGPMRILSLDDMNIRGTQIWIGHKDHCGEDLGVFARAIMDRDQAMVDTINRHGEMGNHTERAVTSGASYERPAPLKRR
ncbi:MAG: hypothetical protein KJ556_21760 [Gammaproteobacteria bacterium]|nr:hypothetical protein [Gammaproteobacteria bacterium]